MHQSKTLSLWLVLFVIFLDWMGIGLVYPMFSAMIFQPDSHLLDPQTSSTVRGWYLGILLAAMSIAQFFSSPILGSLSDQKGRKPLFLISLAIGIVGYVFSMLGVFAKSIIILIVARLFVGIAAGNAAVVGAAIADLSDKDSKTKNFGLYSMACGVGFTIGPFLGGRLSQTSFSLPFLVGGLAVLLNFFLILFFFQETHHTRKSIPIRFDEGLRNVKKAFKIPGLRALFLTILIFAFGWSFFYEFIPVTWIAEYNFDASTIGLFYAYGAGFYAVSAGYLIRPIIKKYKNNVALFFALTSLGFVILLLIFPLNAIWIWIYLPVINFLASLTYPNYNAMISNWAGNDAQGELLGISQSLQSLAFALSPLIAGFSLGMNPHMPMILGGICILIAGCIIGISMGKEIFSRRNYG